MRSSPGGDPRGLRGHFVAILLIALVVRGGIGLYANGRGEMEGLAPRYEQDAYAMAAGYGYVRPVAGRPAQVDLVALADSLGRRGERIGPGHAPPMDAARWRPATLHPPGYSAFLELLYRLLGSPVSLWARLLQAILDAGACVLVARVGVRLAGRFAGLFGGYASALFLPLAYLVTSRVADALTPPLLVAAFACFVDAIDEGGLASWVGFALASAALWMLRPDYAALAPFLLVGAAVLRTPLRRLLAGGALALVLVALLVLPWALRNQRRTGEFNPGGTSSGMVLLQSIGMFANPYGIHLEDEWYDAEARRAGFEDAESPAAARYFRQRYAGIARRNPGLVVKGMFTRLALGLVPPYHWGARNDSYEAHGYYAYHQREGTGPLATLARHPLEILGAYWDRLLYVPVALLLLVACLVCVFHRHSSWRAALFLLLPYAYVVLVHLPLYMTMRMMVPAAFVQWIAAGVAIELLRGRRPFDEPVRAIG